MSGTSVDGVDAALVNVTDLQNPALIAHRTHAFSTQLRQNIIRLSVPGDDEIDLAGSVHTELGELFADIASGLKKEAGETPISVIGCHGQTVRHRPNLTHPFTLQLGSGAVIAQRTGITTVTDFRSADIALGGQGAPFAPFFHSRVFALPGKARAIVNLGGIANVTILPGDEDTPVIGFDTGPANTLLDSWVQQHRGKHYDKDGAWGKTGKLNHALLEEFLADPYFKQPAPKSTGRELFNLSWIAQRVECIDPSIPAVDVQRTLAELTARSVVTQLPDYIDAVYLCGGGAKNPWLRRLIEDHSRAPVETTEALGFPPQWIEAAAFAWIAALTLNKKSSTLPSVTGASGSTVAGAVYFA